MRSRNSSGCRASVWMMMCSMLSPMGLVAQQPTLTPQRSNTTVLLQAVSAVSAEVVWVSGHRGTVALSVNGGQTWTARVVRGGDTLQFRDIHAVDSQTAFILSAGSGELSRIFRTIDGGTTWQQQFVNRHPDAFFDCLDFWDGRSGLAYGDATDGHVWILQTSDAGQSWQRISTAAVPPAAGNEGGFAASGTCLIVKHPGTAWIGTGAGNAARIFKTIDRGSTWSVTGTPMVSGTPSSGITSLSFRDERRGMAVGGDIGDPDGFTQNVIVTTDGGATWRVGARPTVSGALYGSANVPGSDTYVAVGPKGMVLSADFGMSWATLSEDNFWAVGFGSSRRGWAVGPNGRIVKIEFP